MDSPSPDITHMLERHRGHQCTQTSDKQHGLPDLSLHDDDPEHEPRPQLETEEAASRPTLRIAQIFPQFLSSFDGMIPFREDPSPTTLTELWSEAEFAAEYLTALSEVTQEVARWRATYEGMGVVDRVRLHNLEVDLGMELDPETPLFGSPKDDAQIRQSLSHAKEKVEEVYRKIQDEKNVRERVFMLCQVLEALEKVAGLVGRAVAVEAVLSIAKSPATLEDAEVNLRWLEHEIEELGAYIEMQWRELGGHREVTRAAEEVQHEHGATDEVMLTEDQGVEDSGSAGQAVSRDTPPLVSTTYVSSWPSQGWAGCETMGYYEYPN